MNAKNYRNKTLQKFIAPIACFFILNAFSSTEVLAAPEEVQVYLDDFAEVGKFGLDIHTNYVASDQEDGQSAALHEFRATPELSYGINNNWEVAAYWLTVKDPGISPQTDGMKLRARWRPKAPSAESPFYWAANIEVGQLSQRFYPDGTSGEIKLIGVWKKEPWTVGMNLNFDHALKSNALQGTTYEIDTKVSYQIKEGLEVGFENYSYRGEINNSTGMSQSNVTNYLAADFNMGKWDFNVGIGQASSGQSDKTIIKAIIGVPL
jgi:hypothetical protein